MPLNAEYLRQDDTLLDTVLKCQDLQTHVLALHGNLLQLVAIHQVTEENAGVRAHLTTQLEEHIIATFRAIQTLTTHLEKILSGQDPFPPPPRRHRRAVSSPIANPTEEKQ